MIISEESLNFVDAAIEGCRDTGHVVICQFYIRIAGVSDTKGLPYKKGRIKECREFTTNAALAKYQKMPSTSVDLLRWGNPYKVSREKTREQAIHEFQTYAELKDFYEEDWLERRSEGRISCAGVHPYRAMLIYS